LLNDGGNQRSVNLTTKGEKTFVNVDLVRKRKEKKEKKKIIFSAEKRGGRWEEGDLKRTDSHWSFRLKGREEDQATPDGT